jgi:tRNA threonylcarbamoyladenosine biosynthesis protein TsaE
MEYTSTSVQQTTQFAHDLGQQLPPNSIICFYGDLGAGKTTFIKGLVSGAIGSPPEAVNSPTFVYLNIYEGTQTVYHFDLYRLRDSDEFLSMGFDEYLFCGGICCIEWSEKIAGLLPSGCIEVHLEHVEESVRQIKILNWKSNGII